MPGRGRRRKRVRSIQRKLNSRSGITALFALVVFAIAAMVSFAIVTAALNNADRVKGQKAAQREDLAIFSATALMRKRLAGQEIFIVQTLDPEKTSEIEERQYSGTFDLLGRALAKEMLKGTFDALALELSVSGPSGVDTSGLTTAVRVDYDGYHVTMKLTPADGTTDAAPVTLVFDGAKAEMVSEVPNYVMYTDPETGAVWYEIVSWTRTTHVSFPEDQVSALAE